MSEYCVFCNVEMLRVEKWKKYICKDCGREFTFSDIELRHKQKNRGNKYGACKVTVDGIKFDSKKEAGFYEKLKKMESDGEIKDLKLQPKFELQEGFNGLDGVRVRPLRYIADFMFYDNKEERVRVIDAKGFKTKVYMIKKKVFDYLMKDRNIYLEEEI